MGKNKGKCIGKVLAPDIDGDLPEWYLIFPEGWNTYDDGARVLANEAGLKNIKARLKNRGIEQVFDYEHQTEGGGVAPASGWVKDWKWDKGIWAKVDWTERASRMLLSKEYRYFSPVFYYGTDDGVLLAVEQLALTNYPKTNNLKPMVSKSAGLEIDMDLLAGLVAIAALGLTAESTAEEALAAVLGYVEKKEKSEPSPEVEQMATLAKNLGLPSGTEGALVVAKVSALKASSIADSDLSTRLEVLEGQLADSNAVALLAKHSDKITPAMQKNDASGNNYWVTLARQQPGIFEQVVADMPAQIPGVRPGKTDASGGGGAGEALTAEEKQIAKLTGLPEDDMVSAKQGGLTDG